jgi:uncharacterized membrane protein YhaH (DUF805 family)
MIMGGLLGPVQVIILTIIFLVLFITSLVLIIKNERDILKVVWIILIIILPILGSLIYILKYLLTKKS